MKNDDVLLGDTAMYKEVVESSPVAIGMSTPYGRHYYQNKAFDALFGDIGDDAVKNLYVNKDVGKEVFDCIMSGCDWTGEVEMYSKDGEKRLIFLKAYAGKDRQGQVQVLVGMHLDITQQKVAEKKLKQALEEKDILMKELQHRVKNSFTMLNSLMGLKKRSRTQLDIQTVFGEMQLRVSAMAELYSLMYKNAMVDEAPVHLYIDELCELCSSHYAAVRFLSEAQELVLPSKDAAAIGQIILELVSNSVNHAFDPDMYDKTVDISLKTQDSGFLLCVRDNGKGFPDSFNVEKTDSMGYMLLKALVYQLNGKLSVENDKGALVQMEFL